MSVTGIIVEYNPLHNGHIHHIKKTKEITNCDYIIAVMSGNFVQRGEPAIINKWSRTKSALLSGVDLVIELPFLYSTSSAEGFAFGAVSILNSLGIVDDICFGSETDDVNKLCTLMKITSTKEFNEILHKNIADGLSYPKAMQNTLNDYIISENVPYVNIDEACNFVFNSNDILAIEYIKALNKISSRIKPISIKRMYNSYNSTTITGEYSSANSIRKNLSDTDVSFAMPAYSMDILNSDISDGIGPVTIENFKDLIYYNLRKSTIEQLSDLPDVSEGLEYRIQKASQHYTNIDSLIKNIKSKRYTYSRIQRILIYNLIGITKSDYINVKKSPNYIRILGFNDNGRNLLKRIQKTSQIPIITNPSRKEFDLLKYDILSTDLYVLGYKNEAFKSSRQDYLRHPVYI